MKKIMFNDKFGLTAAVVAGRKTMTRRIVGMTLHRKLKDGTMEVIEPDDMFISHGGVAVFKLGNIGYRVPKVNQPAYKIGEEIAIAQSYHSLNKSGYVAPEWFDGVCEDSAGYENKMFVRADLMPHRILIRSIKAERLKSISEADIMREGIHEGEFMNTWDRYYYDEWGDVANHITFKTPRLAFASLINKILGKGTWESNPWVFAYEFELLR